MNPEIPVSGIINVAEGNESIEDEKFIRRTIELANQSLNEGDYPFGAALVADGIIAAEGKNTAKRGDITGHAEINAIKMALDANKDLDLSKCTLYSNFEPCPMCSFAIRDYGIGRVVYSMPSPYWGGSSRWDILTGEIPEQAFAQPKNAHPPKVKGGVVAEEAAKAFEALGWAMHKKG